MLPATECYVTRGDNLNVRKRLLTLCVTNLRQNAEAVFKICESFIDGDIKCRLHPVTGREDLLGTTEV